MQILGFRPASLTPTSSLTLSNGSMLSTICIAKTQRTEITKIPDELHSHDTPLNKQGNDETHMDLVANMNFRRHLRDEHYYIDARQGIDESTSTYDILAPDADYSLTIHVDSRDGTDDMSSEHSAMFTYNDEVIFEAQKDYQRWFMCDLEPLMRHLDCPNDYDAACELVEYFIGGALVCSYHSGDDFLEFIREELKKVYELEGGKRTTLRKVE